MTTFTEMATTQIEKEDFGKALVTINTGKLLLFSTDSIWNLGCDSENPEAMDKIRDLKPGASPYQFEILVSSLKMLKKYVRHLHPRLETLLLYHSRPLTIIVEGAVNLPQQILAENNSVAFRLTHDEFPNELIDLLDRPLFSTFAHHEDLQTSGSGFGSISSDFLVRADYVSKYGQRAGKGDLPPVMVRLSEREELEFLRE